MTFNRYILFRMVVEFVGAIACAIQMFQHHTWPGIITMGVFALVWAVGEIWLSTVYNRAHPRRDELSDEHQATAIRFTFFVLVVALVALVRVAASLVTAASQFFTACRPVLLAVA